MVGVGNKFFFHLEKNTPSPLETPSTRGMPVQELGVGLYHTRPAHHTPKEEEKGVEWLLQHHPESVVAMGVPESAPGTGGKQSRASLSVNRLSSVSITVIPAFLWAK